jgi:hypothetical protein
MSQNLPVNWEERLAKMAEDIAEQEGPSSGSFIGTRGGQLSYQGNPIQGNLLDVIIADFIFENQYYEDDFDPNTPASPVCYAFDWNEDDLAPHPQSAKPQASKCSDCAHNQWGSDPKGGRGKACKNTRRLGLIPAKPLTEEALRKGAVAYLKLPVTSVKGWSSYVRTLAIVHKRPTWSVVTRIGTVPDPKTQFKITFEHVLDVPEELLPICEARAKEVSSVIDFPYQMMPEVPEKPKGKRKF